MAERLELCWTCNSEAQTLSPALTLGGFVLGCPKFKSSTMLVNRQLVCLWPVGILSCVYFHLNYLFSGICSAPLALALKILPRVNNGI